jgi:ABC-type uncharacterized transport system permease subunit
VGIGQAITMPLFFSSNALYPTALMPGWLQAISRVNPLSYEVNALRWLLIGGADEHLAGRGRADRGGHRRRDRLLGPAPRLAK